MVWFNILFWFAEELFSTRILKMSLWEFSYGTFSIKCPQLEDLYENTKNSTICPKLLNYFNFTRFLKQKKMNKQLPMLIENISPKKKMIIFDTQIHALKETNYKCQIVIAYRQRNREVIPYSYFPTIHSRYIHCISWQLTSHWSNAFIVLSCDWLTVINENRIPLKTTKRNEVLENPLKAEIQSAQLTLVVIKNN